MITLKDVFIGGVAGVVGTMAMPVVTKLMYRHESQEKKDLEEKLRPEPPFKTMTKKIVHGVNVNPSKETMRTLSMGMHWGYGIAWGVLYGALRKKYPVLSKFGGALFGTLFFLIGDELVNTAFKITPPPQKFPIDAHVRGLMGHLTFTAAAEGTCKLLHKVV
ncbi:DUF1440 domain-containing protein [Pontibacter sp. E15-1]|uniref:DUF1440 domain-containing protein n=1 Tax=Pontibacter sp. E15-1 TaxID=2919918 RepID=UPI001F5017B4|nr:DUF1440 domain-containing protein [Pontibacter sp. E15-1]MCJ8166015.1 DUF1440 domain-containing protein [Pontibacter sp. E15-1]